MKELVLDAARWRTRDDVYDSFFRAVGAPSWHGRNFNALRDSIGTGQINTVEVPYVIVVRNASTAGEDAAQMIRNFADLIRELGLRGCPVGIRTDA